MRTPVMESESKKLHSPPSIDGRSPSSSARLVKRLSGGVMRKFNSKIRAFSGSGSPLPEENSQDGTPRLINARLFENVESDELRFGSSAVLPTKPVMNLNRRNVPEPLSLGQLTPPPTVRKFRSSTESKYKLESPIDLRMPSFSSSSSSSSGWVTARTRQPCRKLYKDLVNDSRSTVGQLTIDKSLWSSEDELYPEEDSPTYTASVRRNVANWSGSKSYVASKCNVCDEQLIFAMPGEKFIELTCGHQSHFDCYLISFETSFANNRYPKCSICLKSCKPSNEEVLSELTSKVVIQKMRGTQPGEDVSKLRRSSAPTERRSTQTMARSLEIFSPRSEKLSFLLPELNTPHEQLINSADVTSNGFRTPRNVLGSPWSGENSLAKDPNEMATEEVPSLQKKVSHQATLEPLDLRINIIPQLPKLTVNENAESAITQYVLNVYVSKLPDKIIDTKGNLEEEEKLRNEIEDHVMLREDSNFALNRLKMFDQIEFSHEGDSWTLMSCFLFQDSLTFYQEGVLVVRVPLDQISEVYSVDSCTVIFALKTKALPEIYVRSQNNAALIAKWIFYLRIIVANSDQSNQGIKVPLAEMTSNLWNTLPAELIAKIKLEIPSLQVPDSEKDDQMQTVEKLLPHRETQPLKIVVCLSVINCNSELHSNAELLSTLRSKICDLLDALLEHDELGLIIVGKSGSGQVGSTGTFVGMMSKAWKGWKNILKSLKVYDNNGVFLNDLDEMKTMLETSQKLICTVVPNEQSYQHLLIFGNDHKGGELTTIEDDFHKRSIQLICSGIIRKYRFSITQCFTRNGHLLLCDFIGESSYDFNCTAYETLADVNVRELISNLQNLLVRDISVTIQSFDPSIAQLHAVERNGALVGVDDCSELELFIGGLRPGEAKNLLFEVRLDVEELSQFLDSDAYLRSMLAGHDNQPPSLVKFCAQWKKSDRLEHSQGRSMGCDFRFGSTNTFVSSIFNPSTLSGKDDAPNDGECLEISLAPPLTASREALFVARQIQLSVVETLRTCLQDDDLADAHKRLNQLVSIVFCLSRNCVCAIPQFYSDVDTSSTLSIYAEKLCTELQRIAEQATSESKSKTTAYATSGSLAHWQMTRLFTSLVCQQYKP